MKLDCVLTATNDNPLYMDFIPIFVKSWKKLYPNVCVKIIFIGDNLPNRFNDYKEHIIHFHPIKGVSTALTSQYIRLLYPALLECNGGVLITDMDMLPMNRNYYSKPIESINDNSFIYYRGNYMPGHNQIAMCYNIALPQTWGDIFGIKNISDIITRLKDINNNTNYSDTHGGAGWFTDQEHLWYAVKKWPGFQSRFKVVHDRNTGYRRLCRSTFDFLTVGHPNVRNAIKQGFFTDYHALRPYNDHKQINDFIIDCL